MYTRDNESEGWFAMEKLAYAKSVEYEIPDSLGSL